jgi:Sulfotransferase domain
MLVWLASYPRSGNTLLRQVLKGCFDLPSCEGLEPELANLGQQDPVWVEHFGSYSLEGDPEAFYRRALGSAEPVAVKTHALPRDAEKAIYVVRDGRLALPSFLAFQDRFHPGTSSFESLLLGDHPYGEWSGHYRVWCERREGPLLVLRFEELLGADAALLGRIAAFLGLAGPVRPWVNPQAALHARDPQVFGRGDPRWTPNDFWTDARLRAFYTLHGPLLRELGYASAEEVQAGAYPVGSDEERLVRFTRELVVHRWELQRECDARLDVIESLRGELEREREHSRDRTPLTLLRRLVRR